MPRRRLGLALSITAIALVAGSVGAGPRGRTNPQQKPITSAVVSASASASAAIPRAKPLGKIGKPGKGRGKPPAPAACSPRWRPTVSQTYRHAVESWHRPVSAAARTDPRGRPYLTLEILNTNERVEAESQAEVARFSASDLDRLSHALRDTRRGNEHPIDSALVELVYDLQVHFNAGALRVISGYRTPAAGGHSNHGRGRAMDLIVPGVADEDVAKYVRSKGFTGVGVYPSSGFVHVDVRPVSYYWIDRSGPGQKNCEKGTLGNEARANDAAALAAGRRPPKAWAEPAANVDLFWQEHRPPQEAEPHDDLFEEDDLDSDHD